MKVHLIRSKNYDIEDFNNVLNLLRKYRGLPYCRFSHMEIIGELRAWGGA